MKTIINIVNSLSALYSLTVLRCDIQRVSNSILNETWYVGYVNVRDKDGNESQLKILDNGEIEVID